MTNTEVVIGIDVGTTFIKAVAVDRSGHEVYSSSQRIFVDTIRGAWNEQDPKDWWSSSCNALKDITSNVNPNNIKAIGLSGQMHSPAFLDIQDQIIRPSILWNDVRTSLECEQIYNSLDLSTLETVIGNPILEGFTAPKLLWLKNNESDNFEKLSTFLIAKDYIAFMLTGEKSTEPSDASGTVLMDLNTRDWSKEVIESLDLQHLSFPTIHKSAETVGKVSTQASQLTGLLAGTPVIAGGADNAAAAISTGSISENVCQISLGTSGAVVQTTTKPVVDPNLKLHTFSHCIEDRWYSMGVTLSAGGSLSWVADKIVGTSAFHDLDEEARLVSPGSDGLVFLPYLNGERTPHNNPNIRGAFLRIDSSHTKGHMIRSIMEGVAFSIRDVVELMETLMSPAEIFVVTGGGTNSELWSQILADVIGKNLSKVMTNSGPSYGAALIAAVNAGWFQNIEEAVQEYVTLSEYVTSSTEHSSFYEENYRYYKHSYENLK
ncbi:MAG: xylulokinase [Dehalococcoidia bacterium]|nr:xylulokinase [Dehalococcoidia bacterium]